MKRKAIVVIMIIVIQTLGALDTYWRHLKGTAAIADLLIAIFLSLVLIYNFANSENEKGS